jgi:hypothetical protein
MEPVAGFVLLTHAKPRQIQRLIFRLNSMFDHPPIVCHHDFSQCELPVDTFPANVSFVRPHLATEWARFSVVEATVLALRQMYQAPASPDWFVLLSGADYPIKPAAQIRRDLGEGSCDAYIHHELIAANRFERDWQRSCHQRYCVKKFTYPSLTTRLRPTRRSLILRHPLLATSFVPFSEAFRCFAGSQWFSANRRAAEFIVEYHATRRALAAHYRELMFPEESYFQCILANAPHLKLQNCNLRYIAPADSPVGGPHPKTLVLDDLPKLIASPAHFARKFDIDLDAQVLDALDATVV